MSGSLITTVSAKISAPTDTVWQALVDPAKIKQYMFGTTVVSDWKVGGPIVWKGEWEGKEYEDKGEILQIEPRKTLKYSHFSPLAGKPDVPENYHTVTINLAAAADGTQVILSQDNNPDEKAKEQSAKNWQMMLDGLKKSLES